MAPPLTDKQAAFVQEYLVDKCGTAAARRAGYSAKTAQVQSSRLLKDPRVSEAVKAGLDELAAETNVTAERVLQEYARVAFADLTAFVQVEGGAVSVTDTAKLTPAQAAAIAEIAQTRDGQLRVKLHSKTAALEALAQHLGMFIDRSEVKSTVSFQHLDLSNLDDDELEAFEKITAKLAGDGNGSRNGSRR